MLWILLRNEVSSDLPLRSPRDAVLYIGTTPPRNVATIDDVRNVPVALEV